MTNETTAPGTGPGLAGTGCLRGHRLTTLLTGTLGSIHWGILDASIMITAIPCLVLYVALQRHFVRGVMTGIGR